MQLMPAENPYAAPRSDTAFPGIAGAGGDLKDDEIFAFVGESAGYYRQAWASANRTGGFYAGFNVAALIFSTLWLLYRKMYLRSVVLLVMQMAAMFAGAFFATVMGVNPMLGLWPMLLLTKVAIGFLGNGLYLRRARRAIHAARQTNGEINLPFLATKGGTSGGAVVVGIVANVLLNLLLR